MEESYPAVVSKAWSWITGAYAVGAVVIFGYCAWIIWDGLRLKRLRKLVENADT